MVAKNILWTSQQLGFISLNEAAELGFDRVRLTKWANPMDHLKIDIIEGRPGPWVKLFAPFNLECNGRDPVAMLITTMDPDLLQFVRYTGPLPDSDEYRRAVQQFSALALATQSPGHF